MLCNTSLESGGTLRGDKVSMLTHIYPYKPLRKIHENHQILPFGQFMSSKKHKVWKM